ncbi:LysE family translocator [Alphaproteobacteria bacterium]|nr:LysE family translocator [Alphaproteobacteria bacterium]
MSPGPSLAIVIRNNINYNRLAGIMTSIGHGLGIGLYALLAVLGLGFILQTNQNFFLLIQVIGLIFLFFLGLTFIFQKKTEEEKINDVQNQLNSFMQGFLVAIINPKILIWFTAIYSQFLSIEANIFFNLTLILTASIIDAIWYIIVSFAITGYGIKSFLISRKNIIQKITGSILLIISVGLLYNIINQ